MAKMQIASGDAMIRQLQSLGGQAEEITKSMLDSAAEVLEPEIRSSLVGAIGKNVKGDSRTTGELLRSLATFPPEKTRQGQWKIKVGFRHGSGKVPSWRKAMSKEYGTSTEKAAPFIRPAIRKSEQRVMDAMQRRFDEEVEKRS